MVVGWLIGWRVGMLSWLLVGGLVSWCGVLLVVWRVGLVNCCLGCWLVCWFVVLGLYGLMVAFAWLSWFACWSVVVGVGCLVRPSVGLLAHCLG